MVADSQRDGRGGLGNPAHRLFLAFVPWNCQRRTNRNRSAAICLHQTQVKTKRARRAARADTMARRRRGSVLARTERARNDKRPADVDVGGARSRGHHHRRRCTPDAGNRRRDRPDHRFRAAARRRARRQRGRTVDRGRAQGGGGRRHLRRRLDRRLRLSRHDARLLPGGPGALPRDRQDRRL